jgi:aryl-alcohol dehydrogenase-like predicted oxidoreductase
MIGQAVLYASSRLATDSHVLPTRRETGHMDYVPLGRAAVKVSRLCLGTTNFGRHTDEVESHTILDRAVDAGINFIDTADVYGGEPKGRTEEILGHWLALDQTRRDRIVLATKVYGQMGPGANDMGLSACHIRHACEESLHRLQTDHIDLYQMHHVDRGTPWDEIFQAMDLLVQQGKVVYIGSSNFAAWDIATANMIAFQRHFLGLVSDQSIYNLANRKIELEVLPCCAALGMAAIPWSPLGGGLLAGVLARTKEGRRGSDNVQNLVQKHCAQLEKYESLCAVLGHEPAHVGLAWVLHNPAITAPIIGPRTLAQLEHTLGALKVHLSDEAVAKLDEIWPGPGGSAPQAYAW